jgi:6,7-dimethyl-8-ribityllumazine synthase
MSKHVDAVICVGCLVKGETHHFEYLSQAVSQGIMQAQLKCNKPVLFGILPVMSMEHAKARCGMTCKENYGFEWGKSAIRSVELMRKYQ